MYKRDICLSEIDIFQIRYIFTYIFYKKIIRNLKPKVQINRRKIDDKRPAEILTLYKKQKNGFLTFRFFDSEKMM
jgi:hypothetical protein